jgi:isopenicillin N synthase-like dioxygenase
MQGIARGLGLDARWFERHLTADPTVLFRIFRYPRRPTGPPGAPDGWGVAEHTDYGLVTILMQDGTAGLQVRTPAGWVDIDADPDAFVCNIGDMLERMTAGRYRSTPHRVQNTSTTDRLSFPYFFDPGWDVQVVPVPGAEPAAATVDRWDAADPLTFEGTYGDYLLAKVSKVFPELRSVL